MGFLLYFLKYIKNIHILQIFLSIIVVGFSMILIQPLIDIARGIRPFIMDDRTWFLYIEISVLPLIAVLSIYVMIKSFVNFKKEINNRLKNETKERDVKKNLV